METRINHKTKITISEKCTFFFPLMLFLATTMMEVRAQNDRSFMATKFELSPELPADEPLQQENVAANIDAERQTIDKGSQPPASVPNPPAQSSPPPVLPPTNPPPTIVPPQPSPPTLPTLPPVTFLPSNVPLAMGFSSSSPTTTTKPTPVPFLPPLVTSPSINNIIGPSLPQLPPVIYPNGSVFVPTPPPPPFFGGQFPPPLANSPYQFQQPQQPFPGNQQRQRIVPSAPVQIPNANLVPQPYIQPFQSFQSTFLQQKNPNPPFQPQQRRPNLNHIYRQNVPFTNQTNRIFSRPPVQRGVPFAAQRKTPKKSWFLDNFDGKNCSKDADMIGLMFLNKFPKVLLSNGREKVLSELLTARLKVCFQKERENYWNHLNALIQKSINTTTDNLNPEPNECLSGLIQEQISCMNLHSYSCQFIQTSFAFRLLPMRIIVHEARMAGIGAEKCRNFVQKQKIANFPIRRLHISHYY